MAALASRPRRHRFATQRLSDARAQTASYTTCGDMNNHQNATTIRHTPFKADLFRLSLVFRH